MLLTGTALVLAAAAVVIQPLAFVPTDGAPLAKDADAAVRAIVERFYAAVNHGIAKGDTSPLRARTTA